MKFKGLKTIAAVTAVSAGVLFAGANSANASTRVTVKPGDTISELAKTYNVSMQSIKDANKIQDINKIYVGEVFEIGDGEVQVVTPSASETASVAAPVAQAPVAATTNNDAQPAVQAPVENQVASVAEDNTPAAAPAVQVPAQPAVEATPAPAAPVQQAPAQPAATNPVPAQTSAPAASSVSGSDAAAKEWIAARESSGNYNAQNGQYVGKYQLSSSYLNGDYSPANQEAVADNYVTSRYGSWSGAQSFWQSHGWY